MPVPGTHDHRPLVSRGKRHKRLLYSFAVLADNPPMTLRTEIWVNLFRSLSASYQVGNFSRFDTIARNSFAFVSWHSRRFVSLDTVTGIKMI